jgi:hypothetical protein
VSEHDRTTKLIRELFGTTCRCGKPKGSRMTFCGRCYHRLPPPARSALYRRVGEGYEEAYDAAVAILEPPPESTAPTAQRDAEAARVLGERGEAGSS